MPTPSATSATRGSRTASTNCRGSDNDLTNFSFNGGSCRSRSSAAGRCANSASGAHHFSRCKSNGSWTRRCCSGRRPVAGSCCFYRRRTRGRGGCFAASYTSVTTSCRLSETSNKGELASAPEAPLQLLLRQLEAVEQPLRAPLEEVVQHPLRPGQTPVAQEPRVACVLLAHRHARRQRDVWLPHL